MAEGIVAGDEFEAPHLPGAILALAPGLHDRSGVAVVGTGLTWGAGFVTVEPVSTLGLHRPHPVAAVCSPSPWFRLGDHAPGHRRGRSRNVASTKHGINCVAERSLPGRVAGEVVAVLIVDCAATANGGPVVRQTL